MFEGRESSLDAVVVHLLEEGDGLDGLAQTHLVCQDAVLPVVAVVGCLP